MYWVIGIILFFIALIIMVLVSRVTVSITYIHEPNRNECKVHMHVFKGIIHYSWDFPFDQLEVEDDGVHLQYQTDLEVGKQDHEKDREAIFRAESIVQRAHETREIIDSVYQFHKIVRKFLQSIQIEKFEWYSTIGTGDAGSTGVFSGMLWTIKGSLVGLISHIANLKNPPLIEVHPSFQIPLVNTNMQCMFSFRVGKAIRAGYQIAKNWKGRKQHVRTSNPGLDANSNGKY
ncbi:DUF2953 domain-containing protein [Pseudalkalibacillus berkeleyi]|uniref:DUF2953 domain-containing protein n=1 Tax=Pseudalkalibacillus berkeleyi TaxID=1069813 RepID=A0ABS9H2Z8_9BACL|nr:DUF2953 domain-containing protein [Pseudalkalibacillus berkeleyi]MCF6138228.1 DUF2953 domain-containing protein [Pseudalkalibacillus berkeleyi]